MNIDRQFFPFFLDQTITFMYFVNFNYTCIFCLGQERKYFPIKHLFGFTQFWSIFIPLVLSLCLWYRVPSRSENRTEQFEYRFRSTDITFAESNISKVNTITKVSQVILDRDDFSSYNEIGRRKLLFYNKVVYNLTERV